MPTLYKNGKPTEVPAEQVREALLSGFSIPKGSVRVVAEDGRTGTVHSSELLKALDSGFHIEESHEANQRLYGDIGHQAAAGAAGLARGATLGLSDMVMTKSGLVDPNVLDGIRDANPVTSTLSELGGAIAPALLGDEAGVAEAPSYVAKILKGVTAPSRFVSGVGAQTAERVEGQLIKYLTERGVSKALVTAGETVAGGTAASLGKKMLARGVAGMAAGVVEGGIYGTAQAIDEKMLGHPDTVGELLVAHLGPAAIAGGVLGGVFGAGSSALDSMASIASEKLAEDGGLAEAIEGFAQGRAVKGLGAVPSKMGKIEEKGMIEEVGRDLLAPNEALGGKTIIANSIPKTLENIERVRESAGERIGGILKELDATTTAVPVSGPQIAARLRDELLQSIADQPGYTAERKLIERYAKEFDALGSVALSKANQVKTRIQKQIEKLYGKEIDTPANTFRKQIAGVVREEVDSAAETAARQAGRDDLAQQFMEAKRLYASMSEARTLAKSGVKRIEGNRTISLTDYLTGIAGSVAGLATGNVAPMVMAGAGAVGNKLAREHGNLVIAQLANKAAKLRFLQTRLQSVADRISTGIDKFVSGKSANLGRQASTYLLSDLTGKRDRQEAAREFATKLHRYAGNPEQLSTNIAASLGGLEGVAPETSHAVAVKTAQVVTALQQFAPMPPPDALLQPAAHEWKVGKWEAGQFAQMASAYLDPVSVIEEALSGRPDAKGIRIVKLMYPEMTNLIGAQVLEGIASAKRRLSWKERAILATVFDVPVDPLMSPDGIRRAQAVHQASRQLPPQRGSMPKMELDDDAGSLFETRYQQTENLGESR